jgi:lysine biosynthesis protein LysW
MAKPAKSGENSTRVQKGARIMTRAYCPDCDGRIALNPARMGQKITCPHCDADLEVISTDPLELDWVYDWEWDEDEDEDEDDY